MSDRSPVEVAMTCCRHRWKRRVDCLQLEETLREHQRREKRLNGGWLLAKHAESGAAGPSSRRLQRRCMYSKLLNTSFRRRTAKPKGSSKESCRWGFRSPPRQLP